MDEQKTPGEGQERAISEKELHENLNTFEQLAEEPKDKFSVMRFRNNYLDAKERAVDRNGAQREHFQQGVQKGIHPEQDIEKLETNKRLEYQQLKKDTMKEAKDYYHTNYSLTVKFTEKTVVKSKDIPLDKS